MNTNPIIRLQILAKVTESQPATVHRWVKDGILPPYDLSIGRKFRGWKMDTIRQNNPLLATLIEDYLRDQETAP